MRGHLECIVYGRDQLALNPFGWTAWLVAAVRATPFLEWRRELQVQRRPEHRQVS